MSNHIAAKFFNINYSEIPSETFNDLFKDLKEAHRAAFPRLNTHNVNNLRFNFDGEKVSAKQTPLGNELHMVDAEGVYGIKIGNQGLSMSISGYVPYEDALDKYKEILEETAKVLHITHFSRVGLRNINLFEQLETNNFKDIKNSQLWGSQNIGTIGEQFLCNGAATRHEYISKDHMSVLNISSGVVMQGQSFIPQSDWDIWQLRGEVPSIDGVQLLIELEGFGLGAPINEPSKQYNVTSYSWEKVKEKLDDIHTTINGVYDEIAED